MKTKRIPLWEWLTVMIFALFFTLPLLAMARFALQRVPVALLGRATLFSRWTLKGVTSAVTDPGFRVALLVSVRIGLVTVGLVLALMLPTVLALHLGSRRWRPLVEAVSTLPWVVPPIALVVGVAGAYRGSVPFLVSTDWGLAPLYVILSLPFAFRTLDVGASALDVRTLTEAASNLGAGPLRTLFRVLVPNMSASIVSAAFLCFAVVMGEFAIASLLLRPTLPAYMVEIQGREPQGAMAVSLLILMATSLMFMVVGRLSRRNGGVSKGVVAL